MSIPSSIPTNPIIKNLENMISKAQEEILYWKGHHANAVEENEMLLKKLKDLECKLKERE